MVSNKINAGGQIFHLNRPLEVNKGKLAAGVIREYAEGGIPILDTALDLAPAAAGLITGNPLASAGVGVATGAAKEATKKDGDIVGGAFKGATTGGIAGVGGAVMKGFGGAGTAASGGVPATTSSRVVPGGISSNVNGTVGVLKTPVPAPATTNYNLPGMGEGSIKTPAPIAPETHGQALTRQYGPAVRGGIDAAYKTSPFGQVQTIGEQIASGAGNVAKWWNSADVAATSSLEDAPDVCEQFLNKHSSTAEATQEFNKKGVLPSLKSEEEGKFVASTQCSGKQ